MVYLVDMIEEFIIIFMNLSKIEIEYLCEMTMCILVCLLLILAWHVFQILIGLLLFICLVFFQISIFRWLDGVTYIVSIA